MQLRPIAYIHNSYREKFGIPRQSGLADIVSEIVFEKEFRDVNAVRGLEDFSHIWLLWGFSDNGDHDGSSFRPTVRPPRLGGNERVGVFATRSPFRPNPIGLSSVRLKSIKMTDDGPVLVVRGADLMDGTPVYDIKPYLRDFDSHSDARSGFADDRQYNTLEVVFPQELLDMIPVQDREPLVQALGQDPRPHYQDDPERVYGMLFGDRNILFMVSGGTLTVTGIE
ncbi:MAG: tRNA (N6-threonylcarbamoyladenosine(37)-N6)-methyltransferase TrmO [Spirochaetales bacterium]|nr:tRNA (N6-threonylcarbamoyladenosine(37)-N6)-methyltransferase TrmO [Spirochaetales bacterium]MBQ4501941.1 tRNA (N6-threonylcarbamoyladenosine(37)-N6)-methyltransferase TrmO [Spirochaetales bacterium]